MNHINSFLKFFSILFVSMILTQCDNKTSIEYVKEGNENSRRGNYDDAKESYLNAVELDPKNIEGHYGLGGIYNLEKKYEDAEKSFKTSLQLDPTHVNAWYSLGYTYELMGNKEESEKSYEKHNRLKAKLDSIMNKGKP